MVKKAEAERAIRLLFWDWALETDLTPMPGWYPNAGSFMTWLKRKGHSEYLSFRTRASVHIDVEAWLDDEFKRYQRVYMEKPWTPRQD